MCWASCGCVVKKCSNRGETDVVEMSWYETVVVIVDSDNSLSDDQELASDKPTEINDVEGSKRKPLSDIGDKIKCSNRGETDVVEMSWCKMVLVIADSDDSLSDDQELASDDSLSDDQFESPLELPWKGNLAP